MNIGVLKETYPGERRVALIPTALPALAKAGLKVGVEAGAGVESGWSDKTYADRGAEIGSREEVLRGAEVLLQVRGYGANVQAGAADLDRLRAGQIVIGMLDPLNNPPAAQQLAATGVTAFALELLPRITRAQSMDVLSSMATVAGYKAVLLAASTHVKMFPMMMTAAGTITPARVFVIGAGVAGLQAIATARKLGAVVEAYDVRPAVKEQVQSLGAKFIELPLETTGAEAAGGYAKAQDEVFYQKQRQLMARVVAPSDVVICTAAVPGKRAPVLVTAEMVASMPAGAVIVDLAAERGGNCELTRADETVVQNGVTIFGPTNLAATAPYHASQMYAKNISTFLLHLLKDGKLLVDTSDEITRDTLLTQGGDVVQARVREILGLPAPAASATAGA
jgi:NAD(P) transhydrogenase subunit alpha